MEPVPAPRGRVVARWIPGDDNASVLIAGRFQVRVFESSGGWVYDIEASRRFVLRDYEDTASKAGAVAVEYIRSLIAPFGGELVGEGEP